MGKLKELYISNNQIVSLNKSLVNLTSLNLLDLSWNRIKSIVSTEWSQLKKLSRIKLDSNPIEFVEFVNLKKWESLSLRNTSSTAVKSIPINLIEAGLEELDLSYNTNLGTSMLNMILTQQPT
jgi:Leucine-rich repeat (LRR) protein